MCCSFARVPELDKAEHTKCRHCDVGCTIYDKRPGSCRTFECGWLKGELSEAERPDKSGVMLEDYGTFVFAMCKGDEWKTMHSLDAYPRNGRPVVISSLTGNAMLLPEGVEPMQVAALVQEALNGCR